MNAEFLIEVLNFDRSARLTSREKLTFCNFYFVALLLDYHRLAVIITQERVSQVA